MENVPKIRIGIMFGGRSGEHEVSLMSARSVLKVLDPNKYDVTPIGITLEGKWVVGDNLQDALAKRSSEGLQEVTMLPDPGDNTLYARNLTGNGILLEPYATLDVIFPVLHGTFGEDGTLQGLFELMDIAYVGAGVLGSAAGMDKALFKDLMRANHLPVVDAVVVTRNDIEQSAEQVMDQAEALASYPLFVKPANLGSSVGVTKCRTRSDLYEGLLEAARYDRRVLVEREVNAREIEVSVLGNDQPAASIPGEIVPKADFYTYSAKYIDGNTALVIPVPLDASLVAKLQDLAVRAFKAADCSGMCRVDFLLDRDSEEVFIGEINTIPGFTQISMYPKLWEAVGLQYPALIDRLVELAFERKADHDRTERVYGGEA